MDVQDRLSRPLRDLRVSLTDRNFRCGYSMPRGRVRSRLPVHGQEELLTYEEIIRIARAFVGHGVRKIRLTGREPLLRRDLRSVRGPTDVQYGHSRSEHGGGAHYAGL